MLKTRALVAVVALPILIAITLVGGWLFALVILGVLLVGGWEYAGLFKHAALVPPLWLIAGLVGLLWAATWFDHANWRAPGIALALIVGVLYAIVSMERGSSAQPVTTLAVAFFGGVYLGWLGSYLVAVRKLDEGAYLVMLLYGCVAFSDSAAYFVGRAWGRHKLSPRVSPKKTWEGYAGSVVGGPLFGALVGALVPSDVMTALHGAVIGLLIGALGTVGDLGMSVIKRQTGAKDSSHLIPGHGGILDRIDSVLVAAAVGYYYLIWVVL